MSHLLCWLLFLTSPRAVQRLEPIAATCVAALPELLLLSEKILAEGFKKNEASEQKGYTV